MMWVTIQASTTKNKRWQRLFLLARCDRWLPHGSRATTKAHARLKKPLANDSLGTMD